MFSVVKSFTNREKKNVRMHEAEWITKTISNFWKQVLEWVRRFSYKTRNKLFLLSCPRKSHLTIEWSLKGQNNLTPLTHLKDCIKWFMNMKTLFWGHVFCQFCYFFQLNTDNLQQHITVTYSSPSSLLTWGLLTSNFKASDFLLLTSSLLTSAFWRLTSDF